MARIRAPFASRVGPGIAFGAIRLALGDRHEIAASRHEATERAS